uniref:Vesicle-associated protein 1-4 n=1 Tax=Noccaea caerulescens TaxID=107243 RepID=A0A1J3FRT6_NOCCA
MESQMDHKHDGPPQHQVFINFRGDQLRNNFISHLVKALKGKGINVFIDTYEEKGEDIKNLFKRIEESRVALAIFSTRYTESKWCLDELVKIKERVDLGMIKVLPIFYKVPTESVKQLVGEFGDNFRRREWDYRYEQPKIDGWKKALECVTGKLGFTIDEKSSESSSIELIVEEVLRMLASIPLPAHTSNPQKIHQLPGNGKASSHGTFTSEHDKPVQTSNPEKIHQLPENGNTSSQATRTSEHDKAQEVKVISTQPKNILPVSHCGYGPRPLPFNTNASRPETLNLTRRVQETMNKSPKVGSTLNHTKGSRRETLNLATRVEEIMAKSPRLGHETAIIARSSQPKTMYKKVLSFFGR